MREEFRENPATPMEAFNITVSPLIFTTSLVVLALHTRITSLAPTLTLIPGRGDTGQEALYDAVSFLSHVLLEILRAATDVERSLYSTFRVNHVQPSRLQKGDCHFHHEDSTAHKHVVVRAVHTNPPGINQASVPGALVSASAFSRIASAGAAARVRGGL